MTVTATAAAAVLPQVSELIERFAEGNSEREAPVHALKKALQLIASDCHASYARYECNLLAPRCSDAQAERCTPGAPPYHLPRCPILAVVPVSVLQLLCSI